MPTSSDSAASDILALGLCEIVEAIRSKIISSQEVTQLVAAQATRLQPDLNCFIDVRIQDALQSAKQIDVRIAKGKPTGSLAGAVLAHKDLFFRKGKTTTCGSKIFRNFKASFTAHALCKTDDADAVDIGTLHCGEFAASGSGANAHFGPCINPWNFNFTPGGSSSGSAAAVAARIVYGSLGSDTSGSLRWPASACGVCALRPSTGLVSRFGVFPRSWTLDSVGPIARSARDCARIMSVISGPDPNDPIATTEKLENTDFETELERSIKGKRVGVPENYFFDDISSEIDTALKKSLTIFEDMGAEIIPVRVPDMEEHFLLADLVVKAEAAAIHNTHLNTKREAFGADVLAQLEAGALIPAPYYIQALRLRETKQKEFIETVFNTVDILHLPVVPVLPMAVHAVISQSQADLADFWRLVPKCIRPISYLGLPAFSFPCGFSSGGLPIGCQIVGPPFADHALLNFGHQYQQATDWHLRRPPTGPV